MNLLKRLEGIRDELQNRIQEDSQALSHVNSAIKLCDHDREIAYHPDLPGSLEEREDPPEPEEQPHQKPLKKKPYKNLTTNTSILNVLGKVRPNLITAVEVCEKLVEGGWGEEVKDQLASCRAALSHMRMNLKVEKVGRTQTYGLLDVEDT